jgi:hypothetical protein
MSWLLPSLTLTAKWLGERKLPQQAKALQQRKLLN